MAPALMSLRWRQQERVVDSAMRVGGGGGGCVDDGDGNVVSRGQAVGQSQRQ
jgi:hypothetical protein